MPKHLTHVDLQMLLAGTAAVGTNLLPPGLFIARDTTVTNVVGRLGTAPTGGPLTVTITYGTTTLATLTFAAGSVDATASLTTAVPAGTYLQFNVTAIGTTGAGADLSVAVLGTLT